MHGTTLAGRYRLVSVLGSGGMGQVWRAVDERLGRPVAVKVLARSESEDLALRLSSEARTAAALSNPHVVAVHDFGEVPVDGSRVLYLVMELVEGRSLGEVLAEGLPAVGDVVAWGEQICLGLHAAHQAGVVHRDIKPSNILLTADGRVKVCDFGIARCADALGHTLTGTGAVIGTPSYMSPEQARGDEVIGTSSDMYSLGCLLYELLTGEPPFPGGGWQVLAQHLHQTPARVGSRRPDVPAELDRLVAELLGKSPSRRPAEAAEVARRLLPLRAPTAAAAMPATAAVAPPAARLCTAPAAASTPRPTTPSADAGSAPGRSAAWRAGALTSTLVGGQLAVLTTVPSLLAGLLGLLAGVCVAAGSRIEARTTNGDQPDGQGSVVGVFAAMLIAAATMAALLVGGPAPWWAAALAGTVTGPLIVAVTAGVRALVEQVLRHGVAEAELAATAGLFSGAVGAALIAASDYESVAGVIVVGAGAWVASSLAVGALLPVPGTRRSQGQPPAESVLGAQSFRTSARAQAFGSSRRR